MSRAAELILMAAMGMQGAEEGPPMRGADPRRGTQQKKSRGFTFTHTVVFFIRAFLFPAWPRDLCHFAVWDQPWTGEKQLLAADCNQIQEQEKEFVPGYVS